MGQITLWQEQRNGMAKEVAGLRKEQRMSSRRESPQPGKARPLKEKQAIRR